MQPDRTKKEKLSSELTIPYFMMNSTEASSIHIITSGQTGMDIIQIMTFLDALVCIKFNQLNEVDWTAVKIIKLSL